MLGDKVKTLRKSKKLTQQKLASIIGVSQSTIGMIEGNKQGASNDTLLKLATALDTTIDYLLSNNDEIESNNDIELTSKDKNDIEKSLNETLDHLENQQGLMLSGNPVDEDDWEFIKKAIKNGLEYAKKINKEKYTPKKYKK